MAFFNKKKNIAIRSDPIKLDLTVVATIAATVLYYTAVYRSRYCTGLSPATLNLLTHMVMVDGLPIPDWNASS